MILRSVNNFENNYGKYLSVFRIVPAHVEIWQLCQLANMMS